MPRTPDDRAFVARSRRTAGRRSTCRRWRDEGGVGRRRSPRAGGMVRRAARPDEAMFIAELDGAACRLRLSRHARRLLQRTRRTRTCRSSPWRQTAEGKGRRLGAARSLGGMGAGARLGSPDAQRAGHQRPRPRAVRAQGLAANTSATFCRSSSGNTACGHESAVLCAHCARSCALAGTSSAPS